jgi:hypothetical protein
LLKGLGVTGADKKHLPLERILEINGIRDALKVLGSVKGHDGALRLFACHCARYSLDIFEREFPDDKRPRQAIEMAERFARGQATHKELSKAAKAAKWAAMEATKGAARYAAKAAEKATGVNACGSSPGMLVLMGIDDVRDFAAMAVGDAAKDAAWDDFEREFIRLCRLEGEYGEVDKL